MNKLYTFRKIHNKKEMEIKSCIGPIKQIK